MRRAATTTTAAAALLLLLAAALTTGNKAEATTTVCALTCVFGPPRTRAKRVENYEVARAWSRAQGLRLVVAELVVGPTEEFAVRPDERTHVVRRRVSRERDAERVVLWQKEALLNEAFREIPWPDCAVVAWIDSDVMLEDAWLREAAALAGKKAVMQPFSELVQLPRGISTPEPLWTLARRHRLRVGTLPSHIRTSFAANLAAPSADGWEGYPGFAWAASRSLLAELITENGGPLYDRAVVGGADALIARGLSFATDDAGVCESRFNEAMHLHFSEWLERARRAFPDGIVAPSQRVLAAHLWHGSRDKRGYQDRHAILLNADFNPATDVVPVLLDDHDKDTCPASNLASGVLAWNFPPEPAGQGHRLQRAAHLVHEMFREREDAAG